MEIEHQEQEKAMKESSEDEEQFISQMISNTEQRITAIENEIEAENKVRGF